MTHLYQITNTYAKVIFERSETICRQAFPNWRQKYFADVVFLEAHSCPEMITSQT